MNSAPYVITLADLEQVMRAALVKSGYSPCAVEGYVYAQKRYGWLRESTPQDVRNIAELQYTLPPNSGI